MTNRTIAIRSFFRGLGWHVSRRLVDAVWKAVFGR